MYAQYLLLCLLCSQYDASRILAVFPVPSISHQVVFRPIVQELVKRGHEVVVITPDPAFPKGGAPTNLTEIDVHDISYKIWREAVVKSFTDNKDGFSFLPKPMIIAVIEILHVYLSNKEVKKIISAKNQRFDLLLVEACIRPALIFSHIYKVPVIQVSSFGATKENYELIGAPVHPLLYPNMMYQRVYNMTNYEKVTELYKNYMTHRALDDNEEVAQELLKKHLGSDIPTTAELKNNVDMLFLNIHPIFEGIRPVPATVVYMGGMHQKPLKELPKDLKAYLDSSKNGVIYVSFGSNVDLSLLQPEKVQILLRVFSQLPYDILLKWNTDDIPGRADNIKISKWLPQSDLLRHPNIKLFITQGGLQSTDEAITAGVPLVGIPMFGDQWFNVEKYMYHGIGVKIDFKTITEKGFRNSIETVINDDSYRKNIIRLGKIMRDEPMKPLDRAIWWIEYVLRHGGAKHLRAPAANISWAQYLELELVVTLLSIALTACFAFLIAIFAVYKYVLRKYLVTIKVKRT